jgi:predicted phosphohydrolase
MTIQYCSDLHLEFKENWQFLKKNPLVARGEILLLAGDIMPFAVMTKFNDFIDLLSDHFSTVFWLPGNHEYYHFDIDKKPAPLLEKVRDNFFLVNNQAIRYKNINLIFSTLWSHISPRNEWEIQQSISDFAVIKANGKKFTTSMFSSLHKDCLSFLESSIEAANSGETIVITHHVPTLLNYPTLYRNSPLNEAFAVELFDLIENSGAAYWIYGHHHVNIPAFTIGNTKLITNQLGYVQNNEHTEFRTDAVIKLPD